MAVLKVWESHGYECRIVESGEFQDGYQSKNGYVGVPKWHVSWAHSIFGISVDIHGDVSFAQFGKEGDEMFPDPDIKYIGFDTNHWNKGDYDPMKKQGHIWTIEKVIQETEKLAAQLFKLNEEFLSRLEPEIKEYILKMGEAEDNER